MQDAPPPAALGPVATLRAVPNEFAIYGSMKTLEIAPILVAARDHYEGELTLQDGGIPNLIGAPSTAGPAVIATHAETQALRYSVTHPELRIILTVTEARYRIVARRSSGIARLADLKGKRIATLATTSAGYFLARMLGQVRLSFADIQPVRISPIEDMAGALARGDVDAIAIWDPYSTSAAKMLGSDAIEFPGDGVYRERFNLNTTAANLADPRQRTRIVAFVRAIIEASEAIRRDPAPAQKQVLWGSSFGPEEVAASWPNLSFPAALPADLLDVLVDEERWLAMQDKRAPRSRARLARLIDASVLDEALGSR
ncbi:MAG: ABC transporter substrate-binding protein [Sphingomonas sp.]|nr:ABC transporter substrate-binding protein [Sphingomonas sp.]